MLPQKSALRQPISRFAPMFLFAAGILILIALAGCTGQKADLPGTITGRVYLDEDANAECDTCDCDFYLEGIVIRLYKGSCGGLIRQTTETDAEGAFEFTELSPGDYCISPKVKTICEGYKPTTPIQQKIVLVAGVSVEAPWFGFDHNLDINN